MTSAEIWLLVNWPLDAQVFSKFEERRTHKSSIPFLKWFNLFVLKIAKGQKLEALLIEGIHSGFSFSSFTLDHFDLLQSQAIRIPQCNSLFLSSANLTSCEIASHTIDHILWYDYDLKYEGNMVVFTYLESGILLLAWFTVTNVL